MDPGVPSPEILIYSFGSGGWDPRNLVLANAPGMVLQSH